MCGPSPVVRAGCAAKFVAPARRIAAEKPAVDLDGAFCAKRRPIQALRPAGRGSRPPNWFFDNDRVTMEPCRTPHAHHPTASAAESLVLVAQDSSSHCTQLATRCRASARSANRVEATGDRAQCMASPETVCLGILDIEALGARCGELAKRTGQGQTIEPKRASNGSVRLTPTAPPPAVSEHPHQPGDSEADM